MPKAKTKLKVMKKYSIHPTLGKVCVKREEPDEMTQGGIVIPDTAKGRHHVGVVIERGGDDPDGYGAEIKVGDRVVFPQYAGIEFDIHLEKYIVMDYKEVLAVLCG